MKVLSTLTDVEPAVRLNGMLERGGYETALVSPIDDVRAAIRRESPDLVARPLALLYQVLGRNGDAEQRTKLYSWICRLDPLMALNVSR